MDAPAARAPTRLLLAAVAASLLPFCGKAFHVDEPLFLWAARRIQTQPCDPYGFQVNWYGSLEPLHAVMQNPPLTSYLLAASAAVLGWSEAALHAVFLLPALAAAWGAFRLARRFCARPLFAALAGLGTPVFLVSATTLMSDVLLLAFWVWAVELWLDGTERDRGGCLFAAGLLAGLAALSKYFGVALLPLFLAHGLFARRRGGAWLLALVPPVLLLAGYHLATQALYGHSLLLDAGVYAAGKHGPEGETRLTRAFTALAFAGGCVPGTLFLGFCLWGWRGWAAAGLFLGAAFAALLKTGSCGGTPLLNGDGVRWEVLLPLLCFSLGGAHLAALACADFLRRRDAPALLLLLWTGGTLAFTGLLNWTVNARSLLPLAPAAGILLARSWEDRRGGAGPAWRSAAWAAVAASWAVALLAVWSDFRWANGVREAAGEIHVNHARAGRVLWFQGHWGFQYYMEAHGHRAVDFKSSTLPAGEVLVVPLNNTNILYVPPSLALLRETVTRPSPPLALGSPECGAGFYAGVLGPLPFSVVPAPPDRYQVLTVRETIRFSATPAPPDG